MDAIARLDRAEDPGARVVPTMLPGLHRLARVPRRLPRVRGLRLLPAARDDARRDVAAGARQGRADRRGRRRLRGARATGRSPWSCWHDRDRPTRRCASAAWRCATACSSTARRTGPRRCAGRTATIAAASGRKPRAARRRSTACRARAASLRLGEAMAVIPLVKRALPEARLPWQDARVLGAAAAATLGGAVLRRRVRGAARRGGAGRALAAAVADGAARRRPRRLPRRRAQGDRRLRAAAPATPRDATKEHDRCGSHLMAPLLAVQPRGHGAAQARRRAARPRSHGAAVSLASIGLAVEVFAWSERHAGSRARPGCCAAPATSSSACSARASRPRSQLDVGRAALAEILRAEGR